MNAVEYSSVGHHFCQQTWQTEEYKYGLPFTDTTKVSFVARVKRMMCPQFRNSESSIHFFVVMSANDLAPVLNPLIPNSTIKQLDMKDVWALLIFVHSRRSWSRYEMLNWIQTSYATANLLVFLRSLFVSTYLALRTDKMHLLLGNCYYEAQSKGDQWTPQVSLPKRQPDGT